MDDVADNKRRKVVERWNSVQKRIDDAYHDKKSKIIWKVDTTMEKAKHKEETFRRLIPHRKDSSDSYTAA